MANLAHLEILRQGVPAWNRWRQTSVDVLRAADLEGVDLTETDLTGANFIRANLNGANLQRAKLVRANFSGGQLNSANLARANIEAANLEAAFLIGANLSLANLRGAKLIGAHLDKANLQGANLQGADLLGTTLWEADLRRADLRGARLIGATLVESNLEEANLSGSLVFGVAVWKVRLAGAVQLSLNISDVGESAITVDNIEVAQLIYLLLNNEKIRQTVDTLTSKVVLILGRFTPERKRILDAIRAELRLRDYLPVLFDFEKPGSRDLTETVSTLAHLARFVIADITDAKSIPQELKHIVPNLPSVPIQPLLLASQYEYGMFDHFLRFPWVLEPVFYADQEALLAELARNVIAPAEAKASLSWRHS
jgi:uncharacterized protein YjbI with pentapeptide repeats